MEGAPLSRFDNRDLWSPRPLVTEQSRSTLVPGRLSEAEGRPPSLAPRPPSLAPRPIFHYKDFGIQTEPYFDFNFNQLYYLTDTGRRWDGHLYNVRDKATKENPVTNPEFLKLKFHSTNDIIKAINEGSFPAQAMLNFHPQRWNDAFLPWMKEFVWQNVKNQGKRFLVRSRK